MKKKVNYTILYRSDTADIDDLLAIYRENKSDAKVIWSQNKNKYIVTTHMAFDNGGDDFSVLVLNKKYGISKTGRIYSNEKKIARITKNKNGFYYMSNNRVKNLTYSDISKTSASSEIIDYLISRFGWIRHITENHMFSNISFNTIVRKKLYSTRATLAHIFDCPYPVAKMLYENIGTYNHSNFIKVWKEMKKHLKNVDNLKAELMSSPYFVDSCRMAESLGKKVNCSWGLKRLKLEHDKWSKEITSVILKYEPLCELNIRDIFIKFSEYSGYELIKTNHGLIARGREMNNCVGTYSNQVNSGRSGIYVLGEYTIEIRLESVGKLSVDNGGDYNTLLCCGQCVGHSNSLTPKYIINEINNNIKMFNSLYLKDVSDNLKDTSDNLKDTLDDEVIDFIF
jgi:hypothetical protein